MYLQVLGIMLWMCLGPLVSRPHLASRICSFISFAESGKVAAISSSSPYSPPPSSSSGTRMTPMLAFSLYPRGPWAVFTFSSTFLSQFGLRNFHCYVPRDTDSAHPDVRSGHRGFYFVCCLPQPQMSSKRFTVFSVYSLRLALFRHIWHAGDAR